MCGLAPWLRPLVALRVSLCGCFVSSASDWRSPTGSETIQIAAARAAEVAGFNIAVIGDHIGPELAPVPTLTAIAAATSSIRIGAMVVNADVRNPVQLAWEAATLDRLSGVVSSSVSVPGTPRKSTQRWDWCRTRRR